jgi:hypothetical protein
MPHFHRDVTKEANTISKGGSGNPTIAQWQQERTKRSFEYEDSDIILNSRAAIANAIPGCR